MSEQVTTEVPALPEWVREALRCPVTGTALVEGAGPEGAIELFNTSAEHPLAYPVIDGVPVLLEDEARTRTA